MENAAPPPDNQLGLTPSKSPTATTLVLTPTTQPEATQCEPGEPGKPKELPKTEGKIEDLAQKPTTKKGKQPKAVPKKEPGAKKKPAGNKPKTTKSGASKHETGKASSRSRGDSKKKKDKTTKPED